MKTAIEAESNAVRKESLKLVHKIKADRGYQSLKEDTDIRSREVTSNSCTDHRYCVLQKAAVDVQPGNPQRSN